MKTDNPSITIEDLRDAAKLLGVIVEKTHNVYCHPNNRLHAEGDLHSRGDLDKCDIIPSDFCPEFDKDGVRCYYKVEKTRMLLHQPKYNLISQFLSDVIPYRSTDLVNVNITA